jgi:hypothetical protein
MQQRLKQMLRLALGLTLLGAQALDAMDDGGEMLSKGPRRARTSRKRWFRSGEMAGI